MTEEQVTLAISIVGGLLGVALGFFLNLWNSNRIEEKHRNNEKLSHHFDGLKQNIIHHLLSIINGVVTDYGTLEVSTFRGTRTMDDDLFPLLLGFEETDEYQAFHAHYPEIDKTWREIIVQIWKHNKDVNAALEEIKEYISNKTDFPPIKPYDSSKEEKFIPESISLIYRTIYSKARGENPRYDFSKLYVHDQGDYQSLSIESNIVAIISKEKTEKCKVAFLELQNSEKFRDRAQGLGGNAFQLRKRLENLAYKLKDVYDYGLISNTAGHKFTPIKDCVICKRIFY